MSVEFEIVESVKDPIIHANRIKEYTEQGWEIFTHDVLLWREEILYSTMLKRESAKNRVEGAAIREVVERNSREIERLKNRLQVVEDTLDDDTQETDAVYDLAAGDWRSQIVDDAILEDEGVTGVIAPFSPPRGIQMTDEEMGR